MPTYCYKANDGERAEVDCARGKAPGEIVLPSTTGTKTYYRDYRTELSGTMSFVKSSSDRPSRPWPMTCVASGVHADQGAELSEHLGKRGCPTEVKDGDPVYTSAAHRKKALKIRGFADKS